jgi:FdhD protein
VVQEVPVALEYNGISHAVMMVTPNDLEDFALGFSLTEGLIDRADQCLDCEVVTSPQGITLQLTVTAACFARFKDQRRAMTGRTGCGLCGASSLDQAVRTLPALSVSVAPAFSVSALLHAMGELRSAQVLLAKTGAAHAAAWCDAQGQIQLLREDVGRHNALDKLVGAMARQNNQNWASGAVLVTSRASHEMVQKTAAAGVPVLAAVSGVTTLAIETANATGLGLAGFVRRQDFGLYAHPERFLNHI